MLTKMIDGKESVCSEEEEKHIRAKWDLVDKYPEYQESILYDHASMPTIDMNIAKNIHLALISSWKISRIAEMNLQIDMAKENGDEVTEKSLLSTRKKVRNIPIDLSSAKTLDDLKSHLEGLKEIL